MGALFCRHQHQGPSRWPWGHTRPEGPWPQDLVEAAGPWERTPLSCGSKVMGKWRAISESAEGCTCCPRGILTHP